MRIRNPGLTMMALAAAWSLACGRPATPEGEREAAAETRPPDGGIAVVCSATAPERLNAFVSPSELAGDLRLVLFTPLVLYDGMGGFSPHLARGWRFEEDMTRLVLQIRGDVSWHDGVQLTAEDVAWSLRLAADPRFGYFDARDFATMLDAVAIDPLTLEVRFGRPVAEGLEPFVSLPILPKHLLDGMSPEEFQRAAYHREPVGSGPFRFAGRLPDGSLAFDRVDEFPEELGRPHLDRLVLRTIPEPVTALIELETGGVDACIAAASLAADAQRSPALEVLAFEPSRILGLPLDTRQPLLSDARVRRALSAAIHRGDVAAAISPIAVPARTLLPAGSPWFAHEHLQPDGDYELAASLLDSAGWTLRSDGLRRNAAGDPLRFTLVAPQPLEPPLVQLQAQLRRLGVDMRLNFMEFAAYVSMILDPDRRPEAMALGFTPSKAIHPDHFEAFASKGARNLASFSDPLVDSLFQQLRTSGGSHAYAELYTTLQRRVAEDVPVIYTVYVPRLMVVGPRLQGARPDLNGPFTSVAAWWIPAEQRRR